MKRGWARWGEEGFSKFKNIRERNATFFSTLFYILPYFFLNSNFVILIRRLIGLTYQSSILQKLLLSLKTIKKKLKLLFKKVLFNVAGLKTEDNFYGKDNIEYISDTSTKMNNDNKKVSVDDNNFKNYQCRKFSIKKYYSEDESNNVDISKNFNPELKVLLGK